MGEMDARYRHFRRIELPIYTFGKYAFEVYLGYANAELYRRHVSWGIVYGVHRYDYSCRSGFIMGF
jgi:hypothetical protein